MDKKLSYWLDKNNVICQVDEAWDDHMDPECWTDRASSSGVIGKQLFEFICDDVTRMYVATMVQSVRIIGKKLVRPYRCDTPNAKRYWQMVIYKEFNDWICVSHEFVREEPITKSLSFKTVTHRDSPLQNYNTVTLYDCLIRCSICNHFKDKKNNIWLDIDELSSTAFDPLTKTVLYSVCPACLKSLYNSK